MRRAFLSVIILMLNLVVVGCKSQENDTPDTVIIDGKALYGPDGSPLRQTDIKQVSDGNAFLTDTFENFHIEVQTVDSLRFSYVGIVGKTLPTGKKDTFMTVAPEPYMPGNDEYVYNEKYFGEFKNRDDGSTLVIGGAENGYDVSIRLFRLTEIDDGFGNLKDGKLAFNATDASGNPISGEITVGGDTAKLVFTDSSWEYLPKGSMFTFEIIPDGTLLVHPMNNKPFEKSVDYQGAGVPRPSRR